METNEREIGVRLEAATTLLEKTLNWLEERQSVLTGEVERISATVDQSRREAELTEKLAQVERELGDLRAAGAATERRQVRESSGRRRKTEDSLCMRRACYWRDGR